MKHPTRNLVFALLLLITQQIQTLLVTASNDKWYSLGNYIEEEGSTDLTGSAVSSSADGSYIAVSSPHFVPTKSDCIPGKDVNGDDDEKNDCKAAGSRYGRVVVYKFDNDKDTWKLVGNSIVGEKDEALGMAMQLSSDGKHIVIGSPMADKGDKLEVGLVRVYILDRDQWVEHGDPIYGENSFDHFGASVDIRSGAAVLAIGVPGHDVVDSDGRVRPNVGAAGVYKWKMGLNQWEPVEGSMVGRTDSPNGAFGTSVSLSEVGALAIGAPLADNAKGYVEVFKYQATEQIWESQEILEGMEEGEMFGNSVALNKDEEVLAVGAPFRMLSAGKEAGSVNVYKFDGSGFKPYGSVMRGRSQGDEFGFSVSVSDSGDEIAVGSPKSTSDTGKREAGHISVYHVALADDDTDYEWNKMNLDIEGKKEYSHQGYSVSISRDGYQVIGGAPEESYASVHTLAKTAPPTPAPTPAPTLDEGGKGGRGYVTFILVMFIILVTMAVGYVAFKISVRLRARRHEQAFENPNSDGVEMRNVEVVEEGEGII